MPNTQHGQSLGPRTLPTSSVIGEAETREKTGILPQLGRLTLLCTAVALTFKHMPPNSPGGLSWDMVLRSGLDGGPWARCLSSSCQTWLRMNTSKGALRSGTSGAGVPAGSSRLGRDLSLDSLPRSLEVVHEGTVRGGGV